MGTYSHMKYPIYLWNELVQNFTYEILHGAQNKSFTYEMEHSHMKINFTYEIFILPIELKQFTYEILFS